MKNSFELRVISVFLIVLSLCFLSCSTMPKDSFQTRIEKISDDELLNYYNGINDKIKDVDNRAKLDMDKDMVRPDESFFDKPFYMGSEGYELAHRRKLILKELEKRAITP